MSSVREIWRVELRRGLAMLGADEDGAQECFARAYAAAPDEPAVCYAHGRALLRRGDGEEAEPILRRAVDGDPSLVGAAATLARYLGLARGRYDEAAELLDRVDPERVDGAALVVRAELALERGDHAGARSLADRAREREPDDPYVILGATAVVARADNLEGVELVEAGELDAALFCFRRASAGDPEWAAPLLNSSVVFEQLERPGPALRCAEEAVAAEPDHPGALSQRARLLAAAGRVESAITGLLEALAEPITTESSPAPNRPHDAELLCVLGELMVDVAPTPEAAEILVDVAALAPDEPAAWFALAACAQAAGDLGLAEDYARQALALDGEHRPARRLLADLLTRQGRYLEAAAQAERAGALDRGSGVEYRGRPKHSR